MQFISVFFIKQSCPTFVFFVIIFSNSFARHSQEYLKLEAICGFFVLQLEFQMTFSFDHDRSPGSLSWFLLFKIHFLTYPKFVNKSILKSHELAWLKGAIYLFFIIYCSCLIVQSKLHNYLLFIYCCLFVAFSNRIILKWPATNKLNFIIDKVDLMLKEVDEQPQTVSQERKKRPRGKTAIIRGWMK